MDNTRSHGVLMDNLLQLPLTPEQREAVLAVTRPRKRRSPVGPIIAFWLSGLVVGITSTLLAGQHIDAAGQMFSKAGW